MYVVSLLNAASLIAAFEVQGVFVCFVGIFDILIYLMEAKGLQNLSNWSEHGQSWTVDDLMHRDCEVLFMRTQRLNWYALPQEAPVQVAIDLFSKFGLHRMALYDTKGQLSSILTSSQLVRWLSRTRTFQELGALRDSTLDLLNLGTRFVKFGVFCCDDD
jgi:hypothetical protein